jgi:methyl-accepting chemotaxis protein
MQNTHVKRQCRVLATGLVVVLTGLSGSAQERPRNTRDADRATDTASAPAGAAARAEELSAQGKEVLGWTNDFAKEVTQTIEGWLTSGAVTQEKLFSYLYYPVPNTDPIKFTTDYDSLSDRDLQAILEKYLSKSNLLMYAVATDRNGYAPTHDRQFSQPLTGNRAVDLVNNRTKRMFGDQIGFRAARNQKPFLLQTYARDTGETAADLSVPIMVRGRHWGCVRIGFRQVDRQQ